LTDFNVFVKCFYKYMVHELVRYMKSVNMHGEKIKVISVLSRSAEGEPQTQLQRD